MNENYVPEKVTWTQGPKPLATGLFVPGHSIDCIQGLRLVTGPSYALEISLGCSKSDVLCEYGVAGVVAGVVAMALRGTTTM